MRLDLLRLTACGPFTECEIALRPGMNILYGPNEAGKSSALRAVRSLLFGFDQRTTDDFVHSYQQLRVGGVLVDSKGVRLECVRRKGLKATLRDGADKDPIEDSLLQSMLGGVSEEFFTTVFGIDHIRLRDGAQDVVRGQGRIGELLFAAGGVTHLRAKQRAIEDTAGSLYKQSGRNPRINAALSQIKQLNDEIRDLQRSPEEWAKHDEDRRQAVELEGSLKSKLAESESQKARLSRVYSALGLLASWKQRKGELALLAHVVSLPADAANRFQAAREQEILATNSKTKAIERIDVLQKRFDAVQFSATLIENAGKIDALYRRLGSHEKASDDRTVLAGQQRTARDSAKHAIGKLGWDLKLEDAGGQRLPDEKKARVRALGNRYGEVSQRSTLQKKTVERLRSQLEACTTRLSSMATLALSPSLKEALAATAAPIVSLRRVGEAQTIVDQLQQSAEDALARLLHCEGSLDQVRLLKVPTAETIDVFDESLRELQAAAKRVNEQNVLCQADSQRCRQELEALELAESVPTENDLASVRSVRDRGIHFAVQLLGDQEVDQEVIDSFVNEVAEGSDFESSLAPSVRNADAVVDRLRRESERVAKKSAMVAQLHALEAKTDSLNQESAAVEAQQTRWQAEWNQAWKETNIHPATPSEMRAWLRKHADLVTLTDELAAATKSLEADNACINALHSRLLAELFASGAEAPQGSDFDSLLTLARGRVAEAEALHNERRNAEAEKIRLEAEIVDAEREMEIVQGEQISWQADWTAALLPLRLEASALPEQAEAVLGNLDELFRNLDSIDGLKARIWGIDKTAEEFAEAAATLSASVGPDLADTPVGHMVATLNSRLTSAKEAQQLASSLEERLLVERQSLIDAESDLSASRAALEVLLQEAACESLADLPAAITNAATKAALQSTLRDLEHQLLPFCAGKTLEEFNSEAESEDADRLKSAIEELESEIATLREQRDNAIKAIERLNGVLSQYAGAAAAAEKANERQFLLRQLEDDAREYVVATIASRLLHRAVERYREKSQGPVLTEASKYFAKLTCGAFTGLRSDYDESGQEVLVGIRESGTSVRVEGMSEGTRDQLYLALRLGTLEHWIERHEPIPFVVDDVLLTFDDVRASAALEALLELSKKTQVLFFTHHDHLASLASDVAKATNNEGQCNIVSEWNLPNAA